MKNDGYRQCVRCIMDTSDPTISFDENGLCNHCRSFDQRIVNELLPPSLAQRKLRELAERVPSMAEQRLHALLDEIKRVGKGKPYDCVLGLSGGVDSSYLVVLAKKWGLRPLVTHLDNGWDSELAIKNVENLVKATGFDYYNYVVDWEEFRDLQVAYLRASVIDVEVVTDHAILALLYRTAQTRNIKFILMGTNMATELVLPRKGWNYQNKCDLVNLLAIHRRFGSKPLKTYPTLSMYERLYLQEISNIREVSPLDFVDYNKLEAIRVLEKEYGWRYYGGKHYESVFTKFYQGYILPTKFGVDKRRAHLSNLVAAGLIRREEALEEIKKPAYPPDELQEDYEYVIKKLGLSRDEFEAIMKQPPVPHEHFPVERIGRWARFKLRFWDRTWRTVYKLRGLKV